MKKIDIEKLKKILSIPSYTYNEYLLRDYIRDEYSKLKNVTVDVDGKGNLYLTKEVFENQNFVSLVAHLDTVYNMEYSLLIEKKLEKDIVQDNNILRAYHPTEKRQIGLGADDVAGVFIALSILENCNKNIKVVLFVEEETGCFGSAELNVSFFDNVSYCIGLDSIGHNLFSKTIVDTQTHTDQFYDKVINVLNRNYKEISWHHHPYTDVLSVAKKTGVSAMNLPTGAYNIHSHQECLDLNSVNLIYNTIIDIIETTPIDIRYLHPESLIEPNWKLFG